MKKAKIYFGLAITIGILAILEAVSGFVLWLGFPQGGGGGRGLGGGQGAGQLAFWDLSRHTWIDIHDWVAIALTVLVVLHVVLHWKWIVRMVKSLAKEVSNRRVLNAA
ncbi:MAG: hypothetical protein AMJ70_08845 [Dehalococcoidia bacterium SG8_51_3]|nr:MAG: hypothetical protein AMJ70_08845 [Dehalococcoidia bacterium SG8_51_3]